MRQHLRSGDRESALCSSAAPPLSAHDERRSRRSSDWPAVDAAADEICSLCARHGVRPSAEIFHNILGALCAAARRRPRSPTGSTACASVACLWTCVQPSAQIAPSGSGLRGRSAPPRRDAGVVFGGRLRTAASAVGSPAPQLAPHDRQTVRSVRGEPPLALNSVRSSASDMTELPPASPSSPRLGVHPASPRMATGGAPASWHHAAVKSPSSAPRSTRPLPARPQPAVAANMSGCGRGGRLPMPDACRSTWSSQRSAAHRPQRAESLLWTMQRRASCRTQHRSPPS